jgi:hypothetical protein
MIRFYPNEKLQVKLRSLLESEFCVYFENYDFDDALNMVRDHVLKMIEVDPKLATYPRATHKLDCSITYKDSEVTEKTILTIQFWLEPKIEGLEIKEYLSKPVRKRALLFTGDSKNIDAIRVWLGDFFVGTKMFNDEVVSLTIHTLEGELEASVGDYIVEGIAGEFYACKPDIFESSYEEIKFH